MFPHLCEQRTEKKYRMCTFYVKAVMEKITTTTHQQCVFTTKTVVSHVYKNFFPLSFSPPIADWYL